MLRKIVINIVIAYKETIIAEYTILVTTIGPGTFL